MSPTKPDTPRVGIAVSLLTAVAVSGLLIWWAADRADHDMRAQLLQQARLVAGSLDVGSIGTLGGTESDLGLSAYQRIKEHFAAVRSATPKCRFVYLMGRKADGTVFIFADSEPVGSQDYSPPGQVYEEVPASYRRAFNSRAAAVEGPVRDRWGVWVSALIPMANPQTGALVAVLGLDIAAGDWSRDILARIAPLAAVLLLLLIGIAGAFLASRRTVAVPKSVLRRLMPPLAIILVLMMVCAGAALWQQQQQRLYRESTANAAEVFGDLTTALKQQSDGLSAAAHPIAASPAVQKALREGDTELLLTRWGAVFETLHRENHLTHMYFLDAKRTCLLRVHKPQKRGDLIDRWTAVKAERTCATASGIELGPLGTFTLRVVCPVLEGGQRVGYVELGKEIEDVLQPASARAGTQVAVVIRKDRLNRQTWEEGMRLLGRDASWSRLSKNVVSFASNGRLPDALTSWAESHLGDLANRGGIHEVASDGRIWHVSAVPLKDASGATVGDLLIARDIAGAKEALVHLLILVGSAGAVLLALLLCFVYVMLRRTDAHILAQQAALRESERSYRSQFTDSPVAMLLIDPAEGAILDANEAAVAFYGFSRAHMLAKRITDIDTLPWAETLEAMTPALQGKGRILAFRHRLADGSVRDVEVSVTRTTFGGRAVLQAIVYDISDRKVAESQREAAMEDLRQATTRLKLATQAGGVGIWDYDVVNNKLVWDDQMFQLYGTARGQFIGAYEAWQKGLHPEDRHRGDAEIQMALRGERDFNTEFRVVWSNGADASVRVRRVAE